MRRIPGPALAARAALAALIGVAGAAVSVAAAPAGGPRVTAAMLGLVIATYAAVGLLIRLRQPDNAVGRVVLAGVVAWGPGEALLAVAVHRLATDPTDRFAALLGTLGDVLRGMGWLTLVLVLPLLFPDGHRAGSPRLQRWAWRGAALTIGAFSAAGLLVPTSNDDRLAAVDNPVGLPESWQGVPDLLSLVAFLAAIATLVLAVTTLVQRWRHDDALTRQQLLWFGLAFACPLALFPLSLAEVATAWMFAVASLPVPVAIGVAVLQRRLYDVQLAVNRSLTYGALSLLIAGLYAVVVGGVGAMLEARGATWLPWVAAGVVAVSFAPLRNSLQQAANKVTYGQWSQPAEVLAATGRRLADAVDVPGLLHTLAEELGRGLGLPHVAVVDAHGTTLAATGTPTSDVEELPLTAYGVPVGSLRWARKPLRPADRALLADLAHQLGGVLHAATLLEVVRDAQERTVVAREEERRRLRRDLHDGLGPALAALTLQVDALRNRAAAGEADLDLELLRVRAGIQDTVADVRRIVDGLRPPALDELGLVGALRDLAARFSLTEAFEVAIDADPLPPLPAAVEVAAFRIAQEALTNAAKHALARHADVRLSLVQSGLEVRVHDDGVGLAGPRPDGVGLVSMRERAEEIGGTLTVTPVDGGGTRVRAVLPLAGAAAAAPAAATAVAVTATEAGAAS